MKKITNIVKSNYVLYIIASKIYQLATSFGGVKIHNKGCAWIKRSVIGKGNYLLIGEKSFVDLLDVYIRGNNNQIIIGKECRIGRNCSIRIEGNGCHVIVGAKTTMTRDIHICVQEDGMTIEIGDDCMFSNNIIVRTSDSHPIYNGDGVRINRPQSVKIGDHVWIAPQSTILKGVIINDGAIIGSKSLVTKDVPPLTLVAGIPAEVRRINVRWTREELF